MANCAPLLAKCAATYNRYANAIDALGIIFALVVVGGILGLQIWALRRHNRMYPKGRDRISRDPEAAQAMRRFETMWTYLSGGRGGG